MPDSSKKKGAADRNRVAGGQKHEVDYVAKKTGARAATVKSAVRKAGNSRKAVEKAIRRP